jgi:hypothetical protein
VQVVPATQVPDPVQPSPAHCDHFARVPPAAAEVVAAALEVVLFVEVERVVPAVLVDVAFVVVAAEELLTTTPPGPATEVVKDPLST